MGRVDGKVVVVTGGASGIGLVSAQTFAREGASVVVADRNAAGAEEVAAAIRELGGEAVAIGTDISVLAEVQAMVDLAVETYGGLDVLHNNAALTDASQHALDHDIVTMDLDAWERSMAVTLRGTMHACRCAVPAMIARGGGSIINTATNQALGGDLTQTAYAAAKGGVVTLTYSVATQFGKQGIRCNCLSPGLILTPSVAAACPPEIVEVVRANNLLDRDGRPEDLANAALFLGSDESSFITGLVIRVDGGQLAHLPHFAYLREAGATTTK
jgi:NAD(P)-dependent dehydrogenase (short-subunit alcohol dehydrogenase family)